MVIILILSFAFVPTLALAQADPAAANPADTSQGAGSVLAGVASGVWNCVTSPINCAVSMVVTVLGTLLISLVTVLMAISASIFEMLLQFTVVDLSGTLQSLGIAQGIDHVWTAFRDIANILIIGMFVFIAISIILGRQRFGDKAMIARVLIVAVLINFSLLFTRIIIDSSNLVASVFYNEAVASFVPAGSSAGQTNQNSGGIAGAFLGKMGVAGVFETGGVLLSAGVNKGWYVATAFSLAVSTLLLFVSLIFLFGGFLMVSRALLLIFLTVTASLAFASYLIPQFSDSQYGWKGWWETLIKAALFGPLLMIFLWASLVLLSAPSGQASIAAFLLSPADSSHWTAIVILLFAAGFLYLSIRLASMFATQISGFSLAAFVPAMAFGLGGRVAALAGRQVFGREAGKAGAWAGKRAKQIGLDLASPGKGTPPKITGMRARMTAGLAQKAYDFAADKLAGPKGIKERDFNLAHTMLGSEIKKVAGLKGAAEKTFTGPDTKGFTGYEKRQAEKYAREGERVALSKDEQKKFTESVRDAILQANPDIEERNATAKALYTQATQEVERAQQASVQMIKAQTEAMKPLVDGLTKAKRIAENARNSGDNDKARRAETVVQSIEQRIAVERAKHEGDLNHQQSRIREAQKHVKHAEESIESIAREIDEIAKREGSLPEKFYTAQEAAFESARGRFTNTLRERMGTPLAEEDDVIASKARDEVKTRKEKKEIGKVTDILREHMNASSPPPPPPGPPSRPPVGPHTP